MVRRSPVGALLASALVLSVLLASLRPTSSATAQEGEAQELIVVLEDGANPDAVARELGVTPRQVYRHVFRGFAGRVPPAAAAGLRRNPRVAVISENLPMEGNAQHLPLGIDRVDADLHPRAAIGGAPGPAVDADVAVLDTGIMPDHPDLNVVGGVNFVGSGSTECAGTGNWADDRGHGTAIAGVIGARDDGQGVVGVAPGARLWSVKVLDQNNQGTMAQVICGLDWVFANRDKIDAVNASLSWFHVADGPCDAHPLHRAVCRVVNDAAIPVVVVAGNQGWDAATSVPATYEEVITVSALADYDGRPGGAGRAVCGNDRDDTFAAFSNFGPDVDIVAPGVAIQSTTLDGGWSGCGWGTSLAAPHVTGAIALYKARNPGASAAEVRRWLLNDAARPQDSAFGIEGDPDGIPEPVLALGTDPLPIVGQSQSAKSRGAALAHDGNPATAWATAPTKRTPAAAWVRFDLGRAQPLAEIRWQFAATGRADQYAVEVSEDGARWTRLTARRNAPARQWQTLRTDASARYVRFVFRNPRDDPRFGFLGEVEIRGPGEV